MLRYASCMMTKTIPWELVEELLHERSRSREWLETELGVRANTYSNWKKRGAPKNRAADIARALNTTADYLLQVPSATRDTSSPASNGATIDRRTHPRRAGDPGESEVVIPQYNAGGAMGNGLVLDGTAGIIKSWHVDYEWLRLNVRNHTGVRNLCIVTGFGPSMKPLFNPGDPLLLDKGVTTFVHEDSIYFFRVGNFGFIKMVQRIPAANGGMIYRAKSKNPDYDSFDIVEGMDFEVFGKILTIWRSEQF
jgi:phage repressor protein C with HTH and peptisase S24 domain